MSDFILMDRHYKVIAPGPNLSEGDLSAFEAKLGVPLPEQLKNYYRRWNGGLPYPEELSLDNSVCVQLFWKKNAPAARGGALASFGGLYEIDAPDGYGFLESWENFKDRVPGDCLAFGNDPGGSQFLIGVGEHNLGQIYFWSRRYDEADTEAGEMPGYDNVAYIAPTFRDFLLMLREEPLADESDESWISRVYGSWQPGWKIPD